jgi:hypothetical protein
MTRQSMDGSAIGGSLRRPLSLHFLKCYPTKFQQEAIFQISNKTAQNGPGYITKIHHFQLKPQKVAST